jgi:hypothetical protein
MDIAFSSQLEEAVRSHFCSQANKFEPLGGGFSGTPIIRFSIESELWVARAWPGSEESRTKIDNWAKVALHLERHAAELCPWFDSSPIPRPVTWNGSLLDSPLAWRLGDHLWTLTKWVSGQTLKSEHVTHDLLLSYVKQLAGLHRLTREMQHRSSLSKGLIERRDNLVSMQTDLSETACLCAYHPLKNDLVLFLIKCSERLRNWLPTIDRLANRLCDSHWILRDLWRDNLLVDSNNRWVHTVDVGASRFDWPALDFIRLVGSLLKPSDHDSGHAPWENLRDAYNTINPYSDLPPAKDLQTIHEVSTAMSIIFWTKKCIEPNTAPETATSRTNRMKELLKSFLVS